VSDPDLTRDFTVAVFVVHDGKVLLHFHKKLNRWLPPGGHIEPNELPDEAAVREVLEESGVACTLLGDPRMRYDDPSLPRPASNWSRSPPITNTSTWFTSPSAPHPSHARRWAGSVSMSWSRSPSPRRWSPGVTSRSRRLRP
jgi:8-oxo-dGTP pyrophosphatase MutT (NUDIX family)